MPEEVIATAFAAATEAQRMVADGQGMTAIGAQSILLLEDLTFAQRMVTALAAAQATLPQLEAEAAAQVAADEAAERDRRISQARREVEQRAAAERAQGRAAAEAAAERAEVVTEGNRHRTWRGLHQELDGYQPEWESDTKESADSDMRLLRRWHRNAIGTAPYVSWVEECRVLSIQEDRESCTVQCTHGEKRNVSYGARKPTVGHRYALHNTSYLLPGPRGNPVNWQPFIIVQGKSYWLYYHRPEDRHLARVDWPPADDGSWTGYTVGSAPIATEEPERVGWVIGTVDDGAVVVLGLGHEENAADPQPKNFYGISAEDLTTVLWGPRSYELEPLNDDEPFKQTAGKAAPAAGIVTTAEWVKLPTTTLIPARYQFGIGADAYATLPPTFLSDIIIVGQSFPVDNVDQVEVYKHWQVMNAWGAGAEQVAVWAWARTDLRSFSSGPEHEASPYSWYLYTSVGGAPVVEQQLTPAPGPMVLPYFFRTGMFSGALGYEDDILTVYLNMDLGTTLSTRFGRIWAGRFERSGATWVQVGDWVPSDLDMLHVASPDGATGWGASGYWDITGSVDANGWPVPPVTQQWYTVDYGATWQAMPSERPPGCPYPLGTYSGASSNQTRVAIVEATA